MVDLGEVGDALARVEERQRQLAEAQLRALMEQAHRLRGIHHRAAAERDDRVGVEALELLHAGSDLLLGRLRLDSGEHVHRAGAEVATHLLGHATGHGRPVGDDHRS